MKEYIIVSYTDQDGLVKLVNEKLKEGFTPVGGVAERKIFNHQNDGQTTLMQALMK